MSQSSVTVQSFAHAIAKAEGFGRLHTIPTRYHNPGDLKAIRGFVYPGQRSVGKAGHVIFMNDAAGWTALEHQIQRMLDGQSHIYSPAMTLREVARKYAGNSRRWTKNVSWALAADPLDTLAELFGLPPTILFPVTPFPEGIL
jgi:hypothetical protein